jgi:hypothetical protein
MKLRLQKEMKMMNVMERRKKKELVKKTEKTKDKLIIKVQT